MNPQLVNLMVNSHIEDLRRHADASRAAAELRAPSRVGELVRTMRTRTMRNLRLREHPRTATAPAPGTIVHA